MSSLINDFQELKCERELFNDFADKKFECMDLKNYKTLTKEENCSLKKQVDKLESSNLNLKFEILKLSIIENGKINDTKKRLEHNLKECKIDFSCEKDTTKKLNLEVSRLKMDLERANR